MYGLLKRVRRYFSPKDGDVRVRRSSSINIHSREDQIFLGEVYNWAVQVYRPCSPNNSETYYWFSESFHSSYEDARDHAEVLRELYKRTRI